MLIPLAGRLLSGLSAGLMTGTATAALTETAGAGPGRRASLVSTTANMGGLGFGPLPAGLLAGVPVQHDAAPAYPEPAASLPVALR